MFCRLEKFDGPILGGWGEEAYIWDANWIAYLGECIFGRSAAYVQS